MPDDLSEKVITVIAETQHIPIETVTLDSSFQDLNIDSLDGMQILFALENEFDISIPDDAARQLRGVREVVDGVRQLVEAKPTGSPASA